MDALAHAAGYGSPPRGSKPLSCAQGGSARRRMLQAGRFRSTAAFTPRVAGLPPGSFRVVVSFTPQGAFRPSQTSLTGAPVINIAAGAARA